MDTHSAVVERLRSSFVSGVTKPEAFRQTQLMNAMSMLQENEQKIIEAMHKDLAKPKFEALLSEFEMVINEIHYAITNLSTWMKPEYVSTNLATKFDDCFVRREPLGVVLVIGPWNYPLQLLFLPMIGAIAAGNCVIVKPSEVSPAAEALIAELIPKYLSQDCYAVVTGGSEETVALLKNRFDHIFFTGSQAVGRSILQAASVHLTPVTLELGGKSPCMIFGQVNVTVAIRRLMWAKFFNAGQSCVAPDYVLCTPPTRDAMLPEISKVLEEFYTTDPQASPDFPRIVSPRHWTRLMDLLKKSKGRVVVGGGGSPEDRYIAPTVVVDVPADDALMQEEIFGPILPILTVGSVEEAIEFVKGREKPLAVYVFSNSSAVVNQVLENTTSGGFCSNDGIVHITLPTLPFGGVGASGFGSYHGRWGFETFSHRRACMLRGWALERLNGLRYPPYTENKLYWLRWSTSPKSSCSIL
ncbi:aldehyde dehydrogenase family 3 member B1 [Antennarius striatus]|uniref:aldehyde dehydrogenase family 3 member B1 n=1 Tax=Antennarius striatus TaxID=241820 RepID=UPI0035B2910B